MSDFTEYYKKAWELGLIKHTEEIREAEARGYKMAATTLADLGFIEASFALCSCVDDVLSGKKPEKFFVVGKSTPEK